MVWALVFLSSLLPTSVKQLFGKPSVQLQSTQAEVNTDILRPLNVETVLNLCNLIYFKFLHLYNCVVFKLGMSCFAFICL